MAELAAVLEKPAEELTEVSEQLQVLSVVLLLPYPRLLIL
jgi:hypothetical protein